MISAKPDEYDKLWYYIGWLNNGNVFLNRRGEALNPNYPSTQAVADYVKSGGVYVDYCGWPMYYDAEGHAFPLVSPWVFRRFLELVGADPNYCLGFAWKPLEPYQPCNPFQGYPYSRG
ncbi:MAG: hypothetical protein H5U03_06825 [Clostridia bacterium]|nr:hypothetical protein [Clostridia bacterium]